MVATEGLREMEGSALRRLVGRDEAGAGGAARCLVLDCRPFLAHSAGHIRGALNVRCNTIVRRRAKGAVSLEQILPAEGEVRARLRAGLYAAVVVYDERSPRAEALREDSTVALVVRALRRDTARADIRLLAGGYERFSSEYPEFCAKTKSLSNVSPPTSAEPLDLGCSSCGTPFHDQGGPVEILPFLYLGSAYHAARRDMLDALGITALLNVSSDCPNHFEGHYQYKCIPVEDNHKADISSWFMEAIEFIGQSLPELRRWSHVHGALAVAVDQGGIGAVAQQERADLHAVLGSSLVQRGELPQVHGIHTGTMLAQQKKPCIRKKSASTTKKLTDFHFIIKIGSNHSCMNTHT
uniref:protein-tyrosine-phosphatase n=1 Tax=Geospiza parvula TaxID=87175 RepID=A0A8C3M4D7_GEOPR